MVQLGELTPEMCKCRENTLALQMNQWGNRAKVRIQEAIANGQPIDMKRLNHEAKLAASVAKGGTAPFQPENVEFGHLCDECPFRKKHPAKKASLGMGEVKPRVIPPEEELPSSD